MANSKEHEPYTPITEYAEEPNASRLAGRMLVIIFDQRHPDYIVQGRIERVWINNEEPKVLRIKLSGMMRYYPELYALSGDWRYEEEATRTLQLREQGSRATSITTDTVTDEILMLLMGQGYKIKITSPDTKHPEPDEVLPATGPIQSGHA